LEVIFARLGENYFQQKKESIMLPQAKAAFV